uniref:Uncharacterized protein n=1 Tax=Anguilla anguilla TaxID=7936 RepID=A0A0E9QEW6_ANGAN
MPCLNTLSTQHSSALKCCLGFL